MGKPTNLFTHGVVPETYARFVTESYAPAIPPEFLNMWDRPAREWARQRYESEEFRRIRDRFIEIHRELADLRPGPRRSELVREASALEDGD